MKTSKSRLAAVALAMGLAFGGPVLAEISVSQVPSASLARGSTYVWAPISGIAVGAPAPAIVNEINADRLQAATEAALSAKGLVRVDDPREADLVVLYRMITTTRLDANLAAQGAPCEPLCGGRTDYRVDGSRKTQGTLVLDLVDRRTGRLLYRATAERDISSKDASPERLNALLKKMTKALPSS